MDATVAAYFRWRIDFHVNGMLATSRMPDMRGLRVSGDVTDREITVRYDDGRTETYRGGRYAARKINGCYAPLTPKKERT